MKNIYEDIVVNNLDDIFYDITDNIKKAILNSIDTIKADIIEQFEDISNRPMSVDAQELIRDVKHNISKKYPKNEKRMYRSGYYEAINMVIGILDSYVKEYTFKVGDRVTIRGYYDEYRIVSIKHSTVKLQNLITDYMSETNIDTLTLYETKNIEMIGLIK